MSEHSTPDERTELPTDRRMNKLREKGQLCMSNEVAQVASLLAGFLALYVTWSWIWSDMSLCIRKAFGLIARREPLTQKDLFDGWLGLLIMFGPELLLVGMSVATTAFLAVMLQTQFNVRQKWLETRFETLNPIKGIKKVFSIQGLVTTGKALLKLGLILPIGYFSLLALAPQMVKLIHVSIEETLMFTGDAIFGLFWKIMYVLIALAIFDYFYTRWQWFRNNKMTKQEVKDERKSVEGDEATKRKIQNKGLQRIMQRIQQSVPQADVVITNPTHYAIALKYDRDTMVAPKVVAKGRGFLAQRIKKLAKQENVPVIERKPLARALYASTEVGSEIPRELFKAVAEVLAYVYRLRDPHRYRQQTSGS